MSYWMIWIWTGRLYELDSHWINTENVLVGLSEADARNAISIINQ